MMLEWDSENNCFFQETETSGRVNCIQYNAEEELLYACSSKYVTEWSLQGEANRYINVIFLYPAYFQIIQMNIVFEVGHEK